MARIFGPSFRRLDPGQDSPPQILFTAPHSSWLGTCSRKIGQRGGSGLPLAAWQLFHKAAGLFFREPPLGSDRLFGG
jgi:hypothetical protein